MRRYPQIVPSLLIVEDETPIRDGLVELFRASGFDVESVGDGVAGLEALDGGAFDLVVLDLRLPRMDGLEVLSRVRARGDQTPVLVLTARGAEEDVVAGIEAGADDYVCKPFGIRELVARVRGLLRRSRHQRPRTLTIGTVAIDFDAHEVSWPAGTVTLTARQSRLLAYLAGRRGIISREELLLDVWGYSDGKVQTRTVDVHIGQLRATLRDVPGADDWIETVRGRGYRLNRDAS